MFYVSCVVHVVVHRYFCLLVILLVPCMGPGLGVLLFIVVLVLLFLSSLAWGPFWLQCCTWCLVLLVSCSLVCMFSCYLVHRCSCLLVLVLLLVFSTRSLHGARLVHRFSCPLSLSSALVLCMGHGLGAMLHAGGLQTDFKTHLMSCTLGLSSDFRF